MPTVCPGGLHMLDMKLLIDFHMEPVTICHGRELDPKLDIRKRMRRESDAGDAISLLA